MHDFDYETDYKILWDLYWAREQYLCSNLSTTDKKEMTSNVKELVTKTLLSVKNLTGFKSIKKALLDET